MAGGFRRRSCERSRDILRSWPSLGTPLPQKGLWPSSGELSRSGPQRHFRKLARSCRKPYIATYTPRSVDINLYFATVQKDKSNRTYIYLDEWMLHYTRNEAWKQFWVNWKQESIIKLMFAFGVCWFRCSLLCACSGVCFTKKMYGFTVTLVIPFCVIYAFPSFCVINFHGLTFRCLQGQRNPVTFRCWHQSPLTLTWVY